MVIYHVDYKVKNHLKQIQDKNVNEMLMIFMFHECVQEEGYLQE